MSSRLLSFSLALNLVLLGVVGYWFASHHSDETPPPISQTNRTTVTNPDIETSAAAATDVTAPLRWSDLESEDYPTYVANLRKVGCPEPVLHRIIRVDLKDLYAQKAFALVQDFHRDFWDIAAKENVQYYYQTTLAEQVVALCKEPDALLIQFLGEASAEPPKASTANASDNRFTDFLSPGKQEQLRRLAERYETQLRAIHQTDLSSQEKASKLAQLRREMESEKAQILSPEELAEYQLRQSDAAKDVQKLYGVDFSETELRNMAKAIDDYHHRTKSESETDPETLNQNLQTVLGQARFADLNRARSASYQELYKVASDFGLPGVTAAEIFDLRLASEKQSDEIRAAKNRSAEEKQASLDDLEEQVDQTVRAKLGAGAYQSYKAKNGRWINGLGRL